MNDPAHSDTVNHRFLFRLLNNTMIVTEYSYRYMIGLYLEMGPDSVLVQMPTSIQKYRYHFDDAIALLKDLGVHELTLFKI